MQNLTKEWIRLLDILKRDEEIKKDIEELKMWCYVKIPSFKRTEWICMLTGDWYAFIWLKSKELYPLNDIKPDIILWQANYEHLLRYLNWDYSINWDWDFILECCEWLNYTWIEFNLKKPLLEQDEKVLSALCDYLDNIDNLK